MEKDGHIEKTYQKKTQLEHILLRPDTYVGSIEMENSNLWILNEEGDKFEQKNIEFVPGLYKIFDEILVNAADNYQRDKNMDKMQVTISKNQISIWNNGKGIPIQIHKQYNIYVPELIFGHLLTSSNYDDQQKKVTGGRNGYGAKLTNIFSKKFTVETGDCKSKKYFKMVWTDNMSKHEEPIIETKLIAEDFTCITFEPDFKRFHMKELSGDVMQLLKKRVYDLAGVISSTVKVFLNGKKLPINGFQEYVDMYYKKNSSEEQIKVVEKVPKNCRWEVVATISEGQFQQVSFVNSICTTRGGTHVDYITNQITDQLMEQVKKKHKGLQIKPFQIKSHLWVFINSLIENPAFDSQTKETLTTKSAQFGSKIEISEKFIKEYLKSGILDQIVSQAKAKEDAKLAKKLTGTKKSRLLGIPKLEDANDAGTRNAEHCTLIITEGDSAKSLAMAGIEKIGRDKYGVFPLKGKLLNVREANTKMIMQNQEIQNIIKILGLQVGKKYENVKNLRYGSLMIMADQDHDGSHIKGLVINFIHHFWPSLIQINGFLKEFVTPIIKATKGTQVLSFFTIQDFANWAKDKNLAGWKVKYYKGLGTSTDKEAKEYFSQLMRHQINFKYIDDEDNKSIELAFCKKNADLRKEWLREHNPNLCVDHNQKSLRYKDFINKELIHFSMTDNERSIPNICDGLKPGQRKILYACFKRNLKTEIKVAQLSGYVAEHSAYHHGEVSLAQTIIGMAQNFVGSNNINLLLPLGTFGSRAQGGKEAAAPRYIHTNLSKITRYLFPEPDDHLLNYLEDDGMYVEPEWYLPIIPMVLVNGAEGIGTGWSTSIPCYNPREIVESIRKKLQTGEDFQNLNPWFKNYKGEILQTAPSSYLIKGTYNILNEDSLEITELPIKKWTRDYKTFLEGKLEAGEDGNQEIEDVKEYHSGLNVHFMLRMCEGVVQKYDRGEGGMIKNLKLSTTLQTTNMVLINKSRELNKYQDTKQILDYFYDLRLEFYQKRKDYLISKILKDVELLQNKVRFIKEVISGDIRIQNVKKALIIVDLLRKGYKQIKDMTKVKSTKPTSSTIDKKPSAEVDNEMEIEDNNDSEMKDEEQDNNGQVSAAQYNYLLSMPLWSLTYEKVEQLKKELASKELQLKQLEAETIQKMWDEDLEKFLEVLDEIEQQELKDIGSLGKKININSLKLAKGKKSGNQTGGGGSQGIKQKKKLFQKLKETYNSDESEQEVSFSEEDGGDSDFEVKAKKSQKSNALEDIQLKKKLRTNNSQKIEKNSQQFQKSQSQVEEGDVQSQLQSTNNGENNQELKFVPNKDKKSQKLEQKQEQMIKKQSQPKIINKNMNNNNKVTDQKATKNNENNNQLQKDDKNNNNDNEVVKLPSKEPNKFQLNNSILKYLKKTTLAPADDQPAKLDNFGGKISTEKSQMLLSLEDRLKLREQQGDLKQFNESYQQIKDSPAKCQVQQINIDQSDKNENQKEKSKDDDGSILGKRKSSFDDFDIILDSMQELNNKKKSYDFDNNNNENNMINEDIENDSLRDNQQVTSNKNTKKSTQKKSQLENIQQKKKVKNTQQSSPLMKDKSQKILQEDHKEDDENDVGMRRPRRNAAVKRKIVIESDQEDDGDNAKGDDSFDQEEYL